MRAEKFTTFFATKIDPSHEQQVQRYESRVVKAYENIAKAAARASGVTPKVGTAGARGGTSEVIRQQATLQQASGRTRQQLEAQARATARLERQNSALARGLNTTATALNVVQGPLGPLAGRIGAISRAFTELTGVTLGFAAAGGAAFAGIGIANRYAQLEGRLKALLPAQRDVNSALGEIGGIARRARAELEPVADLYIRIRAVAEDVGIQIENAGRLTELAAKAAALSGGTSQTQAAGLNQFAQGIGSGTLAGDELKSVRENTFALAQAISQGLGVTFGELKKLGEEGALTSEVVAAALINSAGSIEAAYSRLPPTLSQAGNALGTSFTLTIGQIDQSIGVTSKLAEAVIFLADNLEGLITIGAGVATAFAAKRIIDYGTAMVNAGRAAITFESRVRSLASARRLAAAQEAGQLQASNTLLRSRQNQLAAEAQAAARDVAQKRAVVRELETQARAGNTAYASTRRITEATRELTSAQSRLIATGAGLRQTKRDLVANSDALTAAQNRLAIAQRRLDAQSSLLTRTKRGLSAAFANVFNATNLLTTALTIGATALFAYANRASLAEQAIKGLTDEQQRLLTATEDSTRALARQNVELAREQKIRQRDKADQNREIALDAQREIARRLGQIGGRTQADEIRRNNLIARINAAASEGKVLNQDQLGKELNDIRSSGNFVGALKELTAAQGEARTTLAAYGFALKNVTEAEKDLSEARRTDLLKGGPKPVSAALLRAQAAASTDTATSATQAANRKAAAAQKELDAQFVVNGKVDPARADEYKRLTAEIIKTKDAEIARAQAAKAGAAAAKREAREQAAAERKAERDRQRVIRQAEQFGERRRDILATYAEESTAISRASDKIEDLFRLADKNVLVDGVAFIGKTAEEIAKIKEKNPLGRGIYTDEQAEKDAAAIERGVRRPLRDLQDDLRLNRDIQGLILEGYDAEARALQTALDLYRQIGDIDLNLLDQLVEEERLQLRVNDALASRQRQLDTIYGQVDAARDAFTDLLTDFGKDPLKSVGNFFNTLQRNFQRQVAQSVSEKLFAGAEDRVRNLVSQTGGVAKASEVLQRVMTEEAQRRQEQTLEIGRITVEFGTDLDDAGTAASNFADALDQATTRIQNAGTGGGAPAALASAGVSIARGSAVTQLVSAGRATAQATQRALGLLDGIEGNTGGLGDVIRVVGQATRQIASPAGNLPTAKQTFNSIFEGLGEGLDKTFGTKFFKGIGASFGDAFQGAGEGAVASGVARAFGIKQSSTGASIGGALGALSGIPGGSIIGGILGGTLGGALKPTKRASATINLDGFGNLNVGEVRGNSASRKKGSSDAANSVIGKITQIAEALGGTIGGTPRISIGVRGDNIRVDPTGRGVTKTKKGAVDFGDDLEAAIAFATKTAIQQGVIVGISEASQRIIQSGQDLEIAIEKAALIESIPRRLLEKTDPVRFAVEELNKEFERTIRILKEAGATDKQFADAQALYALERAEAIEEASQRAGSAIQAFLDDMKAGSNSPLSKRQTFLNAQADLAKFEADIAAGKKVDEDKLLDAARNFQDASRNLNGSTKGFFDDFNYLYDLLARAKNNFSTGTTTLPGSPFEGDQAVKDAIARANGTQVDAINTQTNVLATKLDQLIGTILSAEPFPGGYAGRGGYLFEELPRVNFV